MNLYSLILFTHCIYTHNSFYTYMYTYVCIYIYQHELELKLPQHLSGIWYIVTPVLDHGPFTIKRVKIKINVYIFLITIKWENICKTLSVVYHFYLRCVI